MDTWKPVAIGLSFMSLALQSASAADAESELTPTHSGYIIDRTPFDGQGDGMAENIGTPVGLNSGIEDFRATIEFDLASIRRHRRILTAVLELTPNGNMIPSGGASTIPIQLFSFDGSGTLQLEDFNQGCFVAVFEGLAPFGVPIKIDVTEAVQHARWTHQRFLGFSLRTNVDGAQVNFGGGGIGVAPTLAITYR